MKIRISVIACLLLIVLAATAVAQESGEETANLSRGFHAEKVYDFLGLDTIERFSGNLTLRIPIGQEFHNGHLSYQLALYYNSHIWDFYIQPSSIPPDPADPADTHCPFASSTISYPTISNAGFGWALNFGGFTRCTTVQYPCPEAGAPTGGIYVASDGARHRFFGTSGSSTFFSHDGSNLRLTIVNTTTQTIEFPDGTKHTFNNYDPKHPDSQGKWPIATTQDSLWRISSMSDRFGNHVDFSYSSTTTYTEIMTIVDGERTHRVYFVNGAAPYFPRVLDLVELAAFGGHGAISTYRFEHENVNVAPGGGDNGRGQTLPVTFLTAIDLPDGHAFRMKDPNTGAFYYDTTIPPATTGTLIPGWPWSAVLQKLALPTGGSIEWTYDENDVEGPAAREACSGVSTPITLRVYKRTLHDVDGRGGTWEYRYLGGGDEKCQLACPPNQVGLCASGPRQLTSTSIAPDGVTNVTYYSMYWRDKCMGTVDPSRPWKRAEYGLPFTHWNDTYGTAIGALPSTEVRSAVPAITNDTGPNDPPANDPFFQRTYVKYESDPLPTQLQAYTDFNWRRTYERTALSNAAAIDPETGQADLHPYYATCDPSNHTGDPIRVNCFTEKLLFKWDNFGHFRQTTVNSNISTTVVPSATDGPPQQTAHPSRTTFVKYPDDLDDAKDWVLETPEQKCSADEIAWRTTTTDDFDCSKLAGSATTLFSYNRSTGQLDAQRVLANPGVATSDSDILALFQYERGYPKLESYYGGNQVNWTTADNFTASGSPAYQIQHQNDFSLGGLLQARKSHYTGFNTLTEDAEFDVATGNMTLSRDGTGLVTTYNYDNSGRLTTVTPPSPLAATSILYAAPADPPSVTLRARSLTGAGTFQKVYNYDGLGRIIKETTLMPDAPNAPPDTTFSQIVTAYDPLTDHLATVSTQQDVAHFNPNFVTKYEHYDATGSARDVTAPDNSATHTSHHATGHVISAVQDAAGHTNLRRTTDNDAFGRLYVVHEPSGPTDAVNKNGGDVATTYGYDWADHLAAVDMKGADTVHEGTQTRRFVYDRRGFLAQETHPESGLTKYSDYDARGHAHHRIAGDDNGPFDLTFDYDVAERLKQVSDLDSGHARRPLKEFTFVDSNFPNDFSAGKLHSAKRHNYLSGGDAQVTETYTYGGSGGTISQKETKFSMPGMPEQTFRSQFTYNDFGGLATLTYPTCEVSCGGTGIGTIQRTFSNGRLSSIGSTDGIGIGYGSLTYNANGTVGTVTHPGGVKDIYAPDPTGMPRVKSITVDQFCVGPPLNVSEPADQSIVSGGQATLRMTAIAGAQYVWYQGQSGDTSHLVDSTSGAAFTTPVLASNTSYWVRVSAPDSSGQSCSSSSRTAVVTVKPCTEVSIVAQPQDVTIGSNRTATLSVVAQGVDNLSYQWYEGVSGNTDHLLTGKTAATFTTDALNATTSYWVRVKAATCIRDSATATVHICHIPVITIPPVSQTIGVPDGQSVPATATVTATGDNLSYAWYEVHAGGALDANSSSNTPTLTISLSGTAPRTFKVFVSNVNTGLPAECSNSADATVTFTPVSCNVTFYTEPGDVTVFPGSNTFPLTAGVWATDPVHRQFRFDWYHGINGNAVHFAGGAYKDHQVPDPDHPGQMMTVNGPVDLFGGCQIDLRSDVLMTTVMGALNAPYDIYWCVVSRTDTTCGSGVSTRNIYVSYWQSCPLPPVTLSPSAVVIHPGDTATLNALANWPRLQYQWYEGQSGDTTTKVPGATHSSLTVSSTAKNYWCRVTNECGTASEDSGTATVSVQLTDKTCTPPLIIQQPQSVDIAAGTSSLLSVDATDPNTTLQYTWLVEGPGDPVPHPNDRQTSVTPRQSTKYYAKISNVPGDSCSMTVESARAIVHIRTCASINLTSEPTSVSIYSGTSATLSVAASSNDTIQYQWYRGPDGDIAASALINGATLPSYTTPTLTATTSYWVRMTTASCTVDSTTAVVQVCDPPAITHQPVGGNLTAGQAFFFSAEASGSNLTYEWHEGRPGNEGPVIGSGNAFWFRPTTTNTYFVKVTGNCGPSPIVATSDVITVTVCSPPVIDTQPANTTIFSGRTATLTVTAEENLNTPMTYQWYEVGGGAVGTNSPTFTTSVLTTEKSYMVHIQAGICGVDSDAATVTICDLPEIVNTGTTINIAASQHALLDGTAGPTGSVYTWYRGHSGDYAGSLAIDGGTDVRTVNVNPTVTTTYWASIARGSCVSRTSDYTVNVCIPTIHTGPQDKEFIPNGAPATLSVDAIDAVSYQWYVGVTGDTTNPVSGATASSISVSPSVDTSYWVRVYGSCGINADSAAARVTVCKPPVIVDQPLGSSIALGTTARLLVTATGTNPRFQWYAGAVGTTTTPVGTTASITVTPNDTTSYWVRVTTNCGTQDSNAAVVHVCTTPSITQQPADATIYNGASTTLRVVAQQGTSEPLTYQWYQGASGDATTPVSGATSASFTTPNLTTTTTYWVRVSGGPLCNTVDSTTVTVNVCRYGATVSISPDVNIALGQTTRLTGVADPTSNLYTWYRGQSGDTSYQLNSSVSGNYLDVSPSVTTQYWYQMINGGCTSNSPTVTVNVCVPAITQSPSAPANPVNSGAAVPLSVVSSLSNVTYQWYTGASGDMSHPITGATTASITVNPTATTSYWARVTGTCGVSANSAAATVVVCTPTTISGITPSQWVTLGYSTLLTVSASGTNITYQWYTGNPGDTSHPISGATSASYAATPQNTTTYWARVSSTCGSADSAGSVVSVCATPVIKTQPQSTQVYTNGTASLSVGATNATTNPNAYQWYRGLAGDTSSPVGTNSSVFTTPALTANTNYWVRVSNGTCGTADSQAALITVNACTSSVAAAAGAQSAVGQSVVLTVPASVVAPVQNALQLGGTSYATVPSSTLLDITGPLTVEAWIKVNAIGTAQGIVERYGPTDSGSGGYALRITNTGKLHFFIGNDSTSAGQSDTLDGATTITAGQWHHVAGIYDGAQMRVYVDGVSDGVKSTSIRPGTGTANLIIGAAGNNAATGAYFGGLIDEVRVSNDALYVTTFAPMSHLTASTTTIGLWKFDGQILGDASGNALNASSSSSVAFAEDVPGAKQYAWYQGASGDVSHPLSSLAPATTFTVAPSATTQYWYQVKDGACTANGGTTTVTVCIPQITQQPGNASITNGQSTTLTVAANTVGVTYQWYAGASGVTTSPITGATSASVLVSPTTTTSYWARATSSCARTVDSTAATVTVCQPPAITSQSSSTWIARGSSTTLSVSATGTGLSYQWYVGAVTNDTSSPITGATQSTYVASPLNSTTYWVRVTGSCGTANSTVVTVSVCATPSITTQPGSTGVTANNSATLTVAATEATTTPMTYQWYVGSSGTTTSPISGATGTSYTTPALTTTTSYWVRVSNGTCTPADSVTATVTVCQPPSVTSQTPTISSTSPGSIVTLRATGSGTSITYQWYTGSSGDLSSPINSATQSTCNVAPSNTTNYWVRVSGSCGTANSTTMTVTVCAPPSITSQPASQTIYYNTSATLTVAATESTTTAMSYQWYRGTSGDVSVPIAGATATTYTTPVLTATTNYWVRVVAGNCSTDSGTATVTVCSFTANVGSASSQQSAVGQTVSVVSPVGGTRYAFYQGNSGDTTHPLTGWTTNNFVNVAPTVTTNYWNQVDNGVCIANGATSTVNVCIPQFTTQPASQTVPSGQSVTLTSAANTAGVTYQWYVGTSGTTTTTVSGGTGASLTITPTSNTSYWVRATSSCSRTVDSATATITICTPPSITGQPQNAPPISSGQSSSLRVYAAGSNISYQWYYGQSGSTTSPVNGATSSILTTAASQTTYYWVRITGQCGTIDSAAAMISVIPNITQQPESVSLSSGSMATLVVNATGSYLHYSWRYSNGNPIPGAPDAPTYIAGPVTAPFDVYCNVTSGIAPNNSNVASVTMCDGLQYTGSYVQNNGGCQRYIQVGFNGYPESWSWYRGARGDTSVPVGNSSTLLTCIPGPTTYWVRVSVTDPNTGATCYTDSPAVAVQ